MLELIYKSKKDAGSIGVHKEFKATESELFNVQNFVRNVLIKNKFDAKVIRQIDLVVEEIFVNIAKYAYSPNKGIIDISYEISDDPKKLRVIIKDKGKEFNPLEKEEPDLDASVQERKIGGLGIYIVKNIVDDIKYQRVNDENVLEFIKNI